MRSLPAQAWRVILWLARLGVAWIPGLLITVFGVMYLVNCFNVLMAPGSPVRYSYEAEGGGRVVLRAESYSLNPWKRTGVLTKVTLTDPEGRQVVAVERADVSYDSPVVRVKISEIAGKVVRLPDGKFDFESALPKRDEEESESVLSIEVGKVTLDYEDRTRTPALTQTAIINNLRVDTSHGDTVLAGHLTTQGLQDIPVTAQIGSDDTLWVEGKFQNGDLLAVRPLVERWVDLSQTPEVRNLTADSLRLDGKIRFAKDKAGKFNIWADGQVAGANVTLRPWLINAKLDADLTTNADLLTGELHIRESNRSLDFKGELVIDDPFRVAGDLVATARRKSDIWPLVRDEIPSNIDIAGTEFRGSISYDGRDYNAGGTLASKTLRVGDESFSNISARVSMNLNMLAANIDGVEFAGFRTFGMVRYNPQNQQISGFVRTNEGRLENLASRFGIDNLRGLGTLSATISGHVDRPNVEMLATGTAAWQREDRQWMNVGEFEARGTLKEDVFHVSRIAIDGPLGVVSASGTVNVEDSKVALKVDGGGFELSQIDPELNGLAFLRGNVTGTLQDPQLVGRAEMFDFHYGERSLPAAAADIRLTTDAVKVSNLEARFNTGVIRGDITYQFETEKIEGNVRSTGVMVSHILGAEDVVGRVSIRNGEISGTISDPQFKGQIQSNELIVQSVSIENLVASIEANRREVVVNQSEVQLGEGRLSASGTYFIESGNAEGEFVATNLPLDKLPGQSEVISYDGSVSGRGILRMGADGKLDGSFDGSANDVEVNGSYLGSGQVIASVQDDVVTASGSLGSIERYLQLESGTYNIDSREINAKVVAFNLNAGNIASAITVANKELPRDVRSTLDSLRGSLSASALITGKISDPAIEAEEILLSGLVVNGRNIGQIRGGVTRREGEWRANALTWQHERTKLVANGIYEESGELEASVDLANFDLTLLNAFVPSIPVVTGTASMTAVATGTVDDPKVRASLSLGEFGGVSDDKTIRIPASVELGEVTYENEVLLANGHAYYRGFAGTIEATIPLGAFGENPTEKLTANFNFTERELSAFSEYLTVVDAKRSAGTVDGYATVSGPVKDLTFDAQINLDAKTIAFIDQAPMLQDVKLEAKSDGSEARITGEMGSSVGGFADVNIQAAVPDLLSGDYSLDEILSATNLNGNLTLDNFRWQVKLPEADGVSDATADGEVTLRGDLQQPRIGGRVELSGVTVSVPSEFPEGTASGRLVVNPIFDNLTVVAAPSSTIVVSLGRVNLTGSGTINGTLDNPEIRAPLTLEGGTFRLPTSRIKLEPGGTINVTYAGQPPAARVDLAISGTTTVTARQTSESYQTYFVTLDIRGNLLEPDGLRIQGTSDPGDLTSAQIMALIGQKDLIESLTASAFGNQNALRDTFYSLAIPSLTMGLTEGIASTLQLDYLTLDYNPFDQTIIRAGKSFGRNLMLEVSRQLVEPNQGRLKYEVKLTYRLPVKDQFFSKLRLGVGFDQDRPWKFTIDWSRRF